MKTCKYCNKSYSESEFGVALTTKNKIYRRWKCKYCYLKTKGNLRQKYRSLIIDIKKKKRCKKCGIKDFRVLDFHHKYGDKNFSVGDMVKNGQGLKKIEKEITKCIVLCANCHRILHHKINNGV